MVSITQQSLLKSIEENDSIPEFRKEIARKRISSRPVLKGCIVDNEFRVWCPYCKRIHVHTKEVGSRCPHCVGNLWKDIFGEECEYYIEPFTNKELEALGLVKKRVRKPRISKEDLWQTGKK